MFAGHGHGLHVALDGDALAHPIHRLLDHARGHEFGHDFGHDFGHELGHLGHPIDRVCRPLLGVRLGRRKDLALTTAEAVSASDTC